MMDHRLRRWPNIDLTLGLCIVFAGIIVRQSYRTSGLNRASCIACISYIQVLCML